MGAKAASAGIPKAKFTMSAKLGSARSSKSAKGKEKQTEDALSGEGESEDDMQSSAFNSEADAQSSDVDESEGSGNEDEAEMDTDDEIQAAQAAASKSKKTQKRKRRATSPTSFGETLQSLLGPAAEASSNPRPSDREVLRHGSKAEGNDDVETDEASLSTKKRSKSSQAATAANPILSLAPHLRRSAQSTKLSAKAQRLLLSERKKRLELTRVKDVIGSWGAPGQLLDPSLGRVIPTVGGHKLSEGDLRAWEAEGGTNGYEKKLRKVAQRGIVKLFNAIKAAQGASLEDVDEARHSALVRSVMPKGVPKGSLATASSKSSSSKSSSRSSAPTAASGTVLGGKQAALKDLSKSNFLELIKTGRGSTQKG